MKQPCKGPNHTYPQPSLFCTSDSFPALNRTTDTDLYSMNNQGYWMFTQVCILPNPLYEQHWIMKLALCQTSYCSLNDTTVSVSVLFQHRARLAESGVQGEILLFCSTPVRSRLRSNLKCNWFHASLYSSCCCGLWVEIKVCVFSMCIYVCAFVYTGAPRRTRRARRARG